MIAEYKRSRDQNVINQVLSSLVWLQDHHHEFERLVADRFGAEAAGAVDWSNPRAVCVAGEVTYHDTVAVEEIDRRIDLVSPRHGQQQLARINHRSPCILAPCEGRGPQ